MATGGVINFNNVLSNVNLSFGNFQIFGNGNVVAPSLRGMVIGDNQSVTEDGLTTINLRVTETINGRSVSEMLPTYLKYIATISQARILDPVVTILENTLGNIVWARIGVGVYRGTLNSAFPNADKVYLNLSNSKLNNQNAIVVTSVNDIDIFTYDLTNVGQDNMLTDNTIEIRVYP